MPLNQCNRKSRPLSPVTPFWSNPFRGFRYEKRAPGNKVTAPPEGSFQPTTQRLKPIGPLYAVLPVSAITVFRWLPANPGMADGCMQLWLCDITPLTSSSLPQVSSGFRDLPGNRACSGTPHASWCARSHVKDESSGTRCAVWRLYCVSDPYADGNSERGSLF